MRSSPLLARCFKFTSYDNSRDDRSNDTNTCMATLYTGVCFQEDTDDPAGDNDPLRHLMHTACSSRYVAARVMGTAQRQVLNTRNLPPRCLAEGQPSTHAVNGPAALSSPWMYLGGQGTTSHTSGFGSPARIPRPSSHSM